MVTFGRMTKQSHLFFNQTITNNKNAMSAGPITINNGVTVTIGDGEAWSIV